MSQHYEVVKIKGQWCLRIAATKQAVAWSAKDDVAWRSYVKEAMAAVGQTPKV